MIEKAIHEHQNKSGILLVGANMIYLIANVAESTELRCDAQARPDLNGKTKMERASTFRATTPSKAK